jgi:two-component system alkaline phosphatase synthesis response regulator PhoP
LAGFDRAWRGPFDLIVLDLMLPGKSGLDVCRDLRQRGVQTPVLMLTALGQTYDKVVGLKIGADDYVTKPFEMAELLARIEAVLRRAASETADGDVVRDFGDLRIDLVRGQVLRSGQSLNLTAREFQLLRYFVQHPGTLLTRQELLREVWELDPGISTRTVDVHVASLRQKIEENPKRPKLILTATGLGYRFNDR